MMDLRTNVITDESGSPVAVQIPYEDWLRLEGYLAAVSSDDAPPSTPSDSETPTGDTARSLSGETDELHFQKRLLEEWAELDAEESTRTTASSGDALGTALEAARGILSDDPDPASSLHDLYAEWDRALT